MAATPVAVPLVADTWTIVATGVTTGVVQRKSTAPNVYRFTTVPTGDAAPTDDSLAWLGFGCDNSEIISDSAAIDVYVKAVNVAGEVIVVL